MPGNRSSRCDSRRRSRRSGSRPRRDSGPSWRRSRSRRRSVRRSPPRRRSRSRQSRGRPGRRSPSKKRQSSSSSSSPKDRVSRLAGSFGKKAGGFGAGAADPAAAAATEQQMAEMLEKAKLKAAQQLQGYAPRPPAHQKPGDWFCSVCSSHNYSTRATCLLCHLGKNPKPHLVVDEPGANAKMDAAMSGQPPPGGFPPGGGPPPEPLAMLQEGGVPAPPQFDAPAPPPQFGFPQMQQFGVASASAAGAPPLPLPAQSKAAAMFPPQPNQFGGPPPSQL